MCLSIDPKSISSVCSFTEPLWLLGSGAQDPRGPWLPVEEGVVTSLVWRLSGTHILGGRSNSTFWGWWQAASLSGRPGDVGPSLALSLAEL